MTRLGVISDTHGLVRPEALAALEGVDRILHAGDVGAPEVLAELERIAPTVAVRGNVDVGRWAHALPASRHVDLLGLRLFLVHDLAEADLPALRGSVDAIVCGHSHRPHFAEVEGVPVLNPGSAGPRRFTLPVTLAHLWRENGSVAAEHVRLV